MMKFFRKYNKHLLAVFMALLLIIWLAGDAIDWMVRPDYGSTVFAQSALGEITAADVEQAKAEEELQRLMGLSWRMSFSNPSAPADEQLQEPDWILLQREAERLGVDVSIGQTKTVLASSGLTEDIIRQRAARADRPVDALYQAAAKYFRVQKMLGLIESSLRVPEAPLRVLARDTGERARVDVVMLPAKSFASPEETFTEEEIKEQFEKYKNKVGRPGTLDFGYYQLPRVQVEYVRIDPHTIKDQLRLPEDSLLKEAYTYWREHGKTDPELMRPPLERGILTAQEQMADSNGAAPPEKKPYYENFAEAQERAVAALKNRKAKDEAERVAGALGSRLQDPWLDMTPGPSGYRPAPPGADAPDVFAQAVASLPANLKYEDAITIQKLDLLTADELADVEGFGSAFLTQVDGSPLLAPELAFRVEGIAEMPKERRADTALYLAKFQPNVKPLTDVDYALYFFRVLDVRPGHVPASVDEVREQVVEDLRILRGMERAREAATAFAQNVGSTGLADAWAAAEELSAKVPPDQGGLTQVTPFARGTRLFGVDAGHRVSPLGEVTEEFVSKAFALAEAGRNAPPEVIDMPNQAAVAVVSGVQLMPMYEEDFQARRTMLQNSLQSVAARQALLDWLNPQHIRERNKVAYADESSKDKESESGKEPEKAPEGNGKA
jgi:hypothetical protein